MRSQILDGRVKKIKYEIREIVSFAKGVERLGQKITWENIGDPVAKGEKIPDWIKKAVQRAATKDFFYGYTPTKGLDETREYLAKILNARGGVRITGEDIIFFNGLGDAINKIYDVLRPSVRVIGPSPAYPTHSSAEADHSGKEHITYECDQENNWYPDISDLRKKIKSNPDIAGILIINPNNPTGAVYPEGILREIVKIAKKFDLFIIADEIYLNMRHDNRKQVSLSDVLGGVCGISLKGISKEWPWPGSRCGWIEIYNAKKDKDFEAYTKAILMKRMVEVSSTALPQALIPEIFSDPRYKTYQKERNLKYKNRAELAYSVLKNIKGVNVVKAQGAFYMSVVFKDGFLNNGQKLEIKNPRIKKLVESADVKLDLDKRFVYYLLGATGICLVPLTSFSCREFGFRMTLLEENGAKFRWILKTVKKKIEEYLNSDKV
jgi:alanine-synthesizing transaminase